MTDVGGKPSILCKLGCGQQVEFEYRNFSDGYSYVIYRDFDNGNFHDCPEIPHHELNWTDNSAEAILELQNQGMDIKNEVNNSEFKKLFLGNEEFHNKRNRNTPSRNSDGTISEIEFKNRKEENLRQLENIKVLCSILPIPFFRLFESDVSKKYGKYFSRIENKRTYLLTKLAEKYQKIGDYDNASIALALQNEITHDQTDRIIELQNIIAKKSDMPELDPVQDVLEKMFSKYKNQLKKEKASSEKVERKGMLRKEDALGEPSTWKEYNDELKKLLGRVNISDEKWSGKVVEHNQKDKTKKHSGYTWEELSKKWIKKNDLYDKWKIDVERVLEGSEKKVREPKKTIKHNTIEVITTNEIREKIRKVERMLKSFILKSFNDDVNQFKNAFPKICEDAEIQREKTKIDTLDVPEGDMIDHITLGTVIFIITNKDNSKYFPEWIYTHGHMLYYIKSFRNNMDHYTGENIEELFSNEDKIMVDICCDKIMILLDKITNQ